MDDRNKLEIKVKRLRQEAILPKYARYGDAGLDLYSCEDCVLKPGQRRRFDIGLSISLPPGYAGLIWDKSGIALNGVTVLGGVVDYTYRGEYGVVLLNVGDKDYVVRVGDKIAQLLIQPVADVKVKEVEELDGTTRGSGGFGHTGIR